MTSAFSYLARVLELPPLVAQAAFDERRRARHRAGPLWDVATPDGRIELWGSGHTSPAPRTCFWSYREARGWILTRWHTPIPVRLELVPWSASRAALGVGLAGSPLALSPDPYVDIGRAALNLLAAEMDSWASHELDELEAELRRTG